MNEYQDFAWSGLPQTQVLTSRELGSAQGDAERMNEDGVRVIRVDWQSAIPALRLVEAIPMAISLRIFVPVLLLMCFASACEQIFELLRLRLFEFSSPAPARSVSAFSVFKLSDFFQVHQLSLPMIFTGSMSQTVGGGVKLGLGMLLFGFCGVAAIRSAGCRFCRGAGTGVMASIRFALRNRNAIVISALLSWILLGLLCAAFRLLCWLGTRTHFGITAIASLMHIVSCLVLGIGWLLSLAAIAIDRCDGAEALSRGISYVLSRWLRVVVYAAVCCLMMAICNRAVLWLSDQAHALASSMYRNPDPVLRGELGISLWSTLGSFGELIRLSIFLCEIAIAYVLLRHVEDGVSLREIDGGREIKAADRLVGSD